MLKIEKFKQTEIGEIPKDWDMKQLSSVFDVKYGKSNPKKLGKIPVIGSSGVFDYTESPLVDKPVIIIGRKGTAGKAWYIETPCHPSDTTFYLEDKGTVKNNLRYIYYSLLHRAIKGSDDVIPSLQRHELENLILVLPELPEQEKIFSVLSKIQQAVENQGKIVADLRELKAATIAKLFREGLSGEPLKETEIGEIPQSWEIIPFGNFATLHRGYDLPVQSRETGKVPIIGSNGIVGYHKVGVCKGPGVMTGRSGTIGLSFYHENEYWPLNTSLFVSDFHGNNPLFIHYFFQQFDFKKYAGGVSVPTLNRNMVHSALVSIPKINEQEEIAKILGSLVGKIKLTEQKAETVKLLFSSTLNQLMTGKVRVI